MSRIAFATVWFGGCSGCHMSLLDLDAWLLELATRVELVYGPLADQKTFPDGVDLTLVEGAIANEEHLELARDIRRKTRVLVALGDCAVTGNVTALRNLVGNPTDLLQQIYLERGDPPVAIPVAPGIVPRLIERVVPLHAVVPVDHFLPGCPPSAPRIRAMLEALLAGVEPPEIGRFG
ncbi:MAG: oxidoreductase [Chloroflexaceae bacterium]